MQRATQTPLNFSQDITADYYFSRCRNCTEWDLLSISAPAVPAADVVLRWWFRHREVSPLAGTARHLNLEGIASFRLHNATMEWNGHRCCWHLIGKCQIWRTTDIMVANTETAMKRRWRGCNYAYFYAQLLANAQSSKN